jgi:hypothetical protein
VWEIGEAKASFFSLNVVKDEKTKHKNKEICKKMYKNKYV